MPIALDCTDALGVALGPPEWHEGIGTLILEHRTCLGDPAREVLEKLRLDLAPFPLLAGLGIRIGGRSGRRRSGSGRGKASFDRVETREVIVGGAHRRGRNADPATTRLRSEPNRST